MAVLYSKELPNNMVAEVIELTFGRARITVGKAGAFTYDDMW